MEYVLSITEQTENVGSETSTVSTLRSGHGFEKYARTSRRTALFHAIDKAWDEVGEYMAVDPEFNCGMLWERELGPVPETVQAMAFWLSKDGTL